MVFTLEGQRFISSEHEFIIFDTLIEMARGEDTFR